MGNKSSRRKGKGGDDDDDTIYAPKPGEKIGLDDFKVISLIGRGGFGKVYLARHRGTGKYFALKTMSKAKIIEQHAVDHTMAEREILQRVRHPFIVTLKYAFQTADKLYLVLDYVNGGELFFHLKKEHRFSEDRVRFYAAELILAIAHLHANRIVYRDLKPENILIDSDGHIRVTDFGLSKHLDSEGKTATMCGSPCYIAPEILAGRRYGKQVDWWSLGTLIFQMLTGRPPFYNENRNVMFQKIQSAQLSCPRYLSDNAVSLLEGLLTRDVRKRFTVQAITRHPFFEGINWERVYNKLEIPPFKPTVASVDDTSNVDPQFLDAELPGNTPTAAALKSEENELFNGFTFMEFNDEFDDFDRNMTDEPGTDSAAPSPSVAAKEPPTVTTTEASETNVDATTTTPDNADATDTDTTTTTNKDKGKGTPTDTPNGASGAATVAAVAVSGSKGKGGVSEGGGGTTRPRPDSLNLSDDDDDAIMDALTAKYATDPTFEVPRKRSSVYIVEVGDGEEADLESACELLEEETGEWEPVFGAIVGDDIAFWKSKDSHDVHDAPLLVADLAVCFVTPGTVKSDETTFELQLDGEPLSFRFPDTEERDAWVKVIGVAHEEAEGGASNVPAFGVRPNGETSGDGGADGVGTGTGTGTGSTGATSGTLSEDGGGSESGAKSEGAVNKARSETVGADGGSSGGDNLDHLKGGDTEPPPPMPVRRQSLAPDAFSHVRRSDFTTANNKQTASVSRRDRGKRNIPDPADAPPPLPKRQMKKAQDLFGKEKARPKGAIDITPLSEELKELGWVFDVKGGRPMYRNTQTGVSTTDRPRTPVSDDSFSVSTVSNTAADSDRSLDDSEGTNGGSDTTGSPTAAVRDDASEAGSDVEPSSPREFMTVLDDDDEDNTNGKAGTDSESASVGIRTPNRSALNTPETGAEGGEAKAKPVEKKLQLLLVDASWEAVVIGGRFGLATMCGYAATTVTSAEAALDMLKADPSKFDIVLADTEPPDELGMHLTSAMRAIPALDHIPIIVMAKSDGIHMVFRCLAAGASDHLFKPVREESLAKSVVRNLPLELAAGDTVVDELAEGAFGTMESTHEAFCALEDVGDTEGMSWFCRFFNYVPLPTNELLDRLAYTAEPTSEPPEALAAMRKPDYCAWDISDDNEMLELMIAVFKDFDLVEICGVDWRLFTQLVTSVVATFRDRTNPFHTLRRTFDGFQVVYYILTTGGLASRLCAAHTLALLLAALTRDLEHPGVTNAFLVSTSSSTALAYHNRSPLENSSAVATSRLLAKPACDILKNFPGQVRALVRDTLVDLILGTDPANHFDVLNEARQIVPDGNEDSMFVGADAVSVCKLVLKFADVSHGARAWHVTKFWADLMVEESFRQSDKEASLGKQAGVSANRLSAKVSKIAFDYSRVVVKPTTDALVSVFPELREPFGECAATNVDKWRQRALKEMVSAANEEAATAASPATKVRVI